MLRTMFRSKIHRATVTEANLNYVGSVTIDSDLLKAADILDGEKVEIVNINNGARFETYTITGPAGSGVICLNGAAARLVQPGDLVIIMTFAQMTEEEIADYRPRVVHVDSANRMIGYRTERHAMTD